MSSSTLKDLHGRIAAKRNRLAELYAKKNDQGEYDWTPQERDEIKTIDTALEDLCPRYESLRDHDRRDKANADALKSLNQPYDVLPFGFNPAGSGSGPFAASADNTKSLGTMFVESDSMKAWLDRCKKAGVPTAPPNFTEEFLGFDITSALKTVMTETGTGYSPPNNRTNVVILSAQRRPVVADLVPSDPTELQVVKYMREATFTNNAINVLEGAALGNSQLGYTQISQTVEAIGAYLPVTNQQLADVPSLRGLIDQRLMLQLSLQEENQLLTGNNTSPNLQGFLTVAGLNTQALGSDPRPDAVMKAITAVRFNTGASAGFADPSGVIFHPTDWQNIRLTKDSMGNYLWGGPSEQGVARIWGLPCVITPAITQGTALVGDFQMFSHISRRQTAAVETGLVNDDFIKNQLTLRLVERLSLEIYRAGAFCTVTGL
jgi:HK97 family phage major capsid protein